jgi:hypothetical protein
LDPAPDRYSAKNAGSGFGSNEYGSATLLGTLVEVMDIFLSVLFVTIQISDQCFGCSANYSDPTCEKVPKQVPTKRSNDYYFGGLKF